MQRVTLELIEDDNPLNPVTLEPVEDEKPTFLSTLTPEKKAASRDLTQEEEKALHIAKDVELVKQYPRDYYSGGSATIEAFSGGILPYNVQPGAQEAHPIAHMAGQAVGLIATGAGTAGMAPIITTSKILSAAPTIVRMAAGRMAQTGATFGLKELADNIAEIAGGDKKETSKVVHDTLKSTAFGTGLGAVGTIPQPIIRIPFEAAYGFVTSKLEGAGNEDAAINAALFGVFGLFNRKNLNTAYKVEAYRGARQALIDRMIAKGAEKEMAETVADRYMSFAINRAGGFSKTEIKDFDAFSRAMKKGWKIDEGMGEPESKMKPEPPPVPLPQLSSQPEPPPPSTPPSGARGMKDIAEILAEGEKNKAEYQAKQKIEIQEQPTQPVVLEPVEETALPEGPESIISGQGISTYTPGENIAKENAVKEPRYDKKDIEGIPDSVTQEQTLEQTEPIEERGGGEVERGGILQGQEEVRPAIRPLKDINQDIKILSDSLTWEQNKEAADIEVARKVKEKFPDTIVPDSSSPEVKRLVDLYEEEIQAHAKEAIDLRNYLIENFNISKEKTENILIDLGLTESYTEQALKDWDISTERNIGKIYNALRNKDEDSFLNFRWGGTSDNPILLPESLERGKNFINKGVIAETERIYNLIARTTGKPEINLTKNNKQLEAPKSELDVQAHEAATSKPKGDTKKVAEGLDKGKEVGIIESKGGEEDVDLKGTERKGESPQDTGRAEETGGEALEGTQAEDVSKPEGKRRAGRKSKPGGKRHLGSHEGDTGKTDKEGIHETTGGRHVLGADEGGVDTSAGGERGEREAAGERLPEPDEPGEAAEVSGNYRITDADEVGKGSLKDKYRSNIAVIKLLKQIESENRKATPEEQAILVKYTGWGGMPQVFVYYNKDWHAEYEELEGLLTDDEYTAARASTPNAHYTSPDVIKRMWKALEKLGFKGGRVLDPSMGVGHFFGLIPENLKIKLTGVELDSISGRIAQQLYQGADIRVQGYEETKFPDGFFDVAISNVPFGDYKLHDPRYNKYKFSIHDYFFAKSLDKVRPGGVVMFITSRYTMDKKDSKVRRYIADKADLIGAIRLPYTAFKGNANTEVTTDIIILKKRAEGAKLLKDWIETLDAIAEAGEIPSNTDWIETEAVESLEGAHLNSYFVNHPEMMLGKMALEGSMYGANEPTLKPDNRNIAEAMQDAINRLPENVIAPAKKQAGQQQEIIHTIPAPEDVKEGAYTVQDSNIYKKEGDNLIPQKLPVSIARRVEGMIKVRDAVRSLLRKQMDTTTDASIQAELKALNRVYDDFIKKFGYINAKGNTSAFREDPDFPLLLSLEKYDSETKKAEKADIFFKRVMHPQKRVEKADTAKEALLVSLNEGGKIDFQRMSELTGKTERQLQDELDGLIFENPEGMKWQTADEYLSGNVREKLKLAESAARSDKKYEKSVEALKAVQPADLAFSEIDARLGASWVPAEDVRDFVDFITDTRNAVKVNYSPLIGGWTVEPSRNSRWRLDNSVANNEKWGIKRYSAVDLITDSLNHKLPTVRDTVDDKPVVNVKETEAAREKQYQIKEKFREWVWEDQERRDRLVKKYNEEMNNIRVRQFDGSHLALPGMASDITLRPHQKDAIWRTIQSGNTLLAHVVGSGKTFTMAGAAMEMRRIGLVKKPMFVVPNHLLEQWGAEFMRLYPSANILIAGKEDFTPLKRKTLMSRIATGNWDAVIVAHSSFERLPMSEQAYTDFIQGQINDLEDYITEIKSSEGRGSRIVKEIEKAKRRLEAKLKARLNKEAKDITVTFEELGVDQLFVDEAHKFKNLFFPTKMTRVAGLPNSESNRANDLYLKTQYLIEKNKGRGVVFATGTPVSNSMAELFTMQRYLQPETLRDYSIQHFDSWAANFGEVVSSLELSPEGTGYRVKSRFARFTNMPELMQMFRSVADVQTADMLKLPVPEIKGGKPKVIIAKASQALKTYVLSLAERAEDIRGGKVDPSDDNMLKVTNDGRKAALDMRLIDPAAGEDIEGKVNLSVANIADIWKRTKKGKSAQLVFSDLSTPGSGFNVYSDVKQKLIRAGIPKDEIAFIHDADTDVKKKALFDNVNAGKVRILIGSTGKMGEGMNVQKKLIALHHLDAPWRPSDIEQREGRILRQGNGHGEVEIYRYVTEGSFDAYMWQILENKARFISQVMTNDISVRSAEDVEGAALTYAEVKALASGNPLVLEKVKIDTEIRRLQTLHSQYLSSRYAMQFELGQLPSRIETIEGKIKGIGQDLEKRDIPEKFSITIKNKEYTDRQKAGFEILKIATKLKGSEALEKIGKYAGFDLYIKSYPHGFLAPSLIVRGRTDYAANIGESDKGVIQSLEHTVKSMDNQHEQFTATHAELTKKMENLKAEVDKPFQHGEKLKELTKRQEAINKELDLDKSERTEGLDDKETTGEEGFISLDMLTLGAGRIVDATKNLLKKINPKAAENVAVMKKKGDLGFVKALLASPGKIAGRARYYVVHGKNAVHKQDRLRGIADEKMKEIFTPLKDKDLRAEFEALSWMGDAEGKTYTTEELDEMGVSSAVKDAYLKHRKFHEQVWRLLASHRKAYGGETGHREGHIPHFFENWNVYEMKEETVELEDGTTETREVPAGIAGTFRSLREATAFANGLDPQKRYLIRPKTFQMPDALIAKTVLKDASYFKLVEKLEKSFELTREEAFEMTNELARRKNRRRFLGILMKRKGQTGFRQDDLQKILKEYYNSVARYIALDDFKARVTPKFEKDFGVELGRADQALRDKNIARYVQEYINDMNGVPGAVEDLIDASIKRYLGSFVRSERPTIWAVNKALHFTGVVKLGLFNLSSGIVNLTQLVNTFSKVPVKHFAWAFEKALHPDEKSRAILRRVGVEFDLGLANTGGYSMIHKGGKIVRASMFFFSAAEHINRRVTALAAYRQARKELGYGEKRARLYAREMVDKTQFDYSVSDTSKIFRNPAGRLLGQFKPFAIKQIEFITGLRGAENIKFWVPMLLMAGTAGIPLIEGLSDLIEWLTGKNPLLETKAFLMRWAGDDKNKKRVAEIAMYGVGSQLGIDISRRVGIGDVFPKRGSDLLGPTINTLMQAKKILEKGDKSELVRTITPSVGNLITALETVMNNMEVRDPWRRQHLKYEATPGDVAVKGLGLRPLKEAKLADIEQIRQYETQKYTKLQQKYVDQAIEALMGGDAEGFAEAITKAAEKGVIIDDKAIENEILQKVLPQDIRMILKTRAMQRGDYLETLDFLNE